MNYLIIHDGVPFYTNWFDTDNNFVDGMVVINLIRGMYTKNGYHWFEIEEDSF